MSRNKFKYKDSVEFLGNKGIVIKSTSELVEVGFIGPFLMCNQIFKVGSKEFKSLKKG